MTLVRRVNHPFYSLFDNIMNYDVERAFGMDSKKAIPAVNVKEKEKEYSVEVVAPGYKKEDFKIKLDKDLLTISSEHKEQNEEKEGEKVIRREYQNTSFSRSFTLPQNIDVKSIGAKYEEGLLKVSIPKLEPVSQEGSREIVIG